MIRSNDGNRHRSANARRAIPGAAGWAVLTVLAVALVVATGTFAYDQYSTSRTAGNCADCHGGFRADPYVSLSDGQVWSNSLHNVHRDTMLNGDCEACHGSGGRFPTQIGTSAGGDGLSPYSCSGCHGRSEDGTGTGTEGFGAGLRQHHWNNGETGCVSCHADSDPANKTPVGEDVLPPYYANPGNNHPAMPTDPCNPAPGLNENFDGTTIGLDNDGNDTYDEADAACSTATSTPGEAGPDGNAMIVTAYDDLSGDVTISFGTACSATDHNVEYGLLANVSTYDYSGQACAVGNTGSATFNLPAASHFFLIVGNDGAAEGSYGTDSSLTERPDDTVGAACPVPQDLSQRCD